MVIFQARRANSKIDFRGFNRIAIHSGPKIDCGAEKAPLSSLAVAGFMKFPG
jgi:hypothetical protein